jgi:hypothetical protein
MRRRERPQAEGAGVVSVGHYHTMPSPFVVVVVVGPQRSRAAVSSRSIALRSFYA